MGLSSVRGLRCLCERTNGPRGRGPAMRVSNPGKGARRNAGRSPARSSRLQGARRLKKIEHRNFFVNKSLCEGHECLNSLSRCVLYLCLLVPLLSTYPGIRAHVVFILWLRWFGQTDQMAGLGFGPRWDGDRRLDPLKTNCHDAPYEVYSGCRLRQSLSDGENM